jgi:hypothetical protein
LDPAFPEVDNESGRKAINFFVKQKTNKGILTSLGGWKVFYTFTFFMGVALLIMELGIYRATIVKMIIPVSIVLAVGVITLLLNRGHYSRVYQTHWLFFPLGQHVMSWGLTACYLFMAANYYLANKERHVLEFEIESKESVPGSRGRRLEEKRVVMINYSGISKELIFKREDTRRVKDAHVVTLTVRKGFLGFDVIDHYDVVDPSPSF